MYSLIWLSLVLDIKYICSFTVIGALIAWNILAGWPLFHTFNLLSCILVS